MARTAVSDQTADRRPRRHTDPTIRTAAARPRAGLFPDHTPAARASSVTRIRGAR